MAFQPYDRLGSLAYNALVKRYEWTRGKRTSHLWERLWQKNLTMFPGPVATTIHGQRVIINPGNKYPIITRLYPTYNNPLIELVYQTFLARRNPISLVDVGAATGDTILLLKGNCPGMIEKFYCVDGDAEFYGYLQHNLGRFSEGCLLLSMLSSSEGMARELVRTHATTASAQGDNQVPTTTLNKLLHTAGATQIEVLKIDVDGFDGQVLCGADAILQSVRPNVIFEWHPILCDQTQNSYSLHFEVLTDCGYSSFIWFDKFGNFSHFMNGFDAASVKLLKDFCVNSKTRGDWHYDVVALPSESGINPQQLAELDYANNRLSPV